MILDDVVMAVKGGCVALLLAPLAVSLSFNTLQKISIISFVLLFVVIYWRRWRKWRVHIDGYVAPGFEKVEQAFRKNIETGQEQGGSFAVYQDGKLVVDLWGGYADHTSLRYRTKESTNLFYSGTKIMTSICLEILAERKLLDYKAPVVKYWPEFGQNNKEGITVETLLCHRAGLLAIRDRHKLSILRDNPDELRKLLEKQKPLWKPGTGQGYHMLTFGLYADELMRRVDPQHRNISQFFREEIAEPFDIDFSIGESKSQYYRACRELRSDFGFKYFLLTTVPACFMFVLQAIRSIIMYQAIPLMLFIGNPSDWRPKKLNDPDFRELGCGSSHGIGTARAVAKVMGILANGGKWMGKTLLSQASIDHLGTPITDDFDRLVLRRIRYGPGSIIFHIDGPDNKRHEIVGHWGAGGQMVCADTSSGTGWAYGTNYANLLHGFILDHRYEALQNALYECLHEQKKLK